MRLLNFNAGPARLPVPVLESLQQAVVDYNGMGMSILEMSHRSPEVEAIINDAKERLARLLALPSGYAIVFVTGGASMQFVNIPLNFLLDGGVAAYANTGVWAKKAIAEAVRFGRVHIAASGEPDGFFRIPAVETFDVPTDACYLHITSNNTIFGTQYKEFPQTSVPLFADMSSDLLSRRIPSERFDLIYAGAQKNLGPAGVTVVVLKESLFDRMRADVPNMQSYKVMAAENSLYNTPPVFQILAVREVLRWIEDCGGLDAIEAANERKGQRLYGAIDARPDFWRSPVDASCRSLMNVTFRLPSEELEKKFVAEARQRGMVGLKGHRSVGGIRVSMYNALLPDELEPLIAFMEEFVQANG